jgi:hypothetical protein
MRNELSDGAGTEPLFAFDRSIESGRRLSDADFFARLQYDESVSRTLRRAARAADMPRLAALLAKRAGGNRAACSADRQSLWSRRHLDESPRAGKLIREWIGGSSPPPIRRGRSPEFLKTVHEWIAACGDGPLSSFETLVLFEILRDAGHDLGPQFPRLWRMGLTTAARFTLAGDGSRDRFDAVDGRLTSERDCRRSIEIELGWQASLLFSIVSGADRIGGTARDLLRRQLIDLTDSAGIPSAQIIEELPVWVASLLRAREWGQRFARPLFDATHDRRFRQLIWSAVRLCRSDGKLPLSNGLSDGLAGMWAAAAALLNRVPSAAPVRRHIAALAAGQSAQRVKRRRRKRVAFSKSNGAPHRGRIAPVFQSDESRLACLRSDWEPRANCLVVSHHGPFPTIELAARGTLLLSGDWRIDVRIDGRETALAGPWSCSCWSSDDDGDYLELQTRASADVRVERQLLLTREDDLLFLADAVIGPAGARIECSSRLPLVREVDVATEIRTRSCRLAARSFRARAFPLALPCDRVMGSAGQFSASPGQMELRQVGVGNLYAPLVIDWSAARRRAAAAWTPLTVALNGRALASSAASAYRLQIGDAQWLVYRSLSPICEPRSVLGLHTMHETVIGRFDQKGNVEPLVLVEQSAPETSQVAESASHA